MSDDGKPRAHPRLSVVIPIYNEEGILQAAVVDLREQLLELAWPFEIILAENGSRDGTVTIARSLCEKYPEVQFFSLGEPNYGKALREGILRARGEFVVCDEIDLCLMDFYRRALDLLERDETDLVIGSKTLAGASDERGAYRHAATMLFNGLLRVTLGFKGSDTHGLKAFRRVALLDVVRACLVDKDVFASELVIRAERSGVRIKEIPIRILEKRPPSINLLKRVPNVMKNVVKLFVAIRVRG
ncbi:MAG: glycosyltransferase [Polyangiales bacterium]|jgi:glycosyltransferase involved in cell wall biosynthesis